jgi:hypothetical protein
MTKTPGSLGPHLAVRCVDDVRTAMLDRDAGRDAISCMRLERFFELGRPAQARQIEQCRSPGVIG